MATATSIVRFHQQDRTITFQVQGRATMNHSLPMRRCGERALEAGVNRICVDLRDCTYMDSTFLGTLLTLKKAVARSCNGELVLMAPSVPCCRILQQMGLLEVLPMEAIEIEPTAAWTELAPENPDAGSFKRNIAQAHEELASLPGPAGEQFKAVARCMAQAEKQPPASPAAPPKE
jgi:anti-anti-sigma factor